MFWQSIGEWEYEVGEDCQYTGRYRHTSDKSTIYNK